MPADAGLAQAHLLQVRMKPDGAIWRSTVNDSRHNYYFDNSACE